MNVCEVSKDFKIENIIPFFQPIMDLRKNSVWGYECLARLIDEGQNVFLPSDFLYLIEEERCYGELTQKIFRESAHYFRHVQVNWSINLTERDIIDAQTLHFLQQYLLDYPNSHRVTLEVCADAVTQYPAQFKAFLLLGKTLDIRILVDRFKTPQSQVMAVLDYPIDGVKIASKALMEIGLDKRALNNLRQKAKDNEVAIVAEQIENGQTLQCIQAMHIDYGQGFYISSPGPGAN